MDMHMNSVSMQQCIANCQECHSVCLSTVAHCLEKGGRHAEASHVTLLLDCADICRTSADFMLRGSSLHGRTCAACADICRHCAEACERLGDDDEMRRCAEACRRCAESCAAMAA
jgi:hypothetical protein